MSPIIVNAGTSSLSSHMVNTRKNPLSPEEPDLVSHGETTDEQKSAADTEKAREERKATGRSIAIMIFISLMCLALYHVVQRKTTILAGVSRHLVQ